MKTDDTSTGQKKLDQIAQQIVELDRQNLLQKGRLIHQVKQTIEKAGGRTAGFSFKKWAEEVFGPRGKKNPRRTMLNWMNVYLTFGRGKPDLSTLSWFEDSALFDLAECGDTSATKRKPPCPTAIREAIRRAKSGERITRLLARELIEKHSQSPTKKRKK